MSRYIVRCPDGNHVGYPYWDKVILNFLNGRTRLHDVFNKHKSKIDQIIYKYTNKVILSNLLGSDGPMIDYSRKSVGLGFRLRQSIVK